MHPATLLRFRSAFVASLFFLLPFTAFAHEHRVLTIGDKQYSVVVGALNEPVYVDDRSGVEVIVSDLSAPQKLQAMADGEGDDGPTGVPVQGLEKTLKVEVIAGDKKQTFSLEPQDGKPGSYQAVFFPTVQTVYTYHLTGTINGIPLDASYTCSTRITADVPEDKTVVHVSDKVTQTLKGGAFGCPLAKADAQFPEHSSSLIDISATVESLAASKAGIDIGALGLIAGLVGIGFGVAGWIRAGKKQQ